MDVWDKLKRLQSVIECINIKKKWKLVFRATFIVKSSPILKEVLGFEWGLDKLSVSGDKSWFLLLEY